MSASQERADQAEHLDRSTDAAVERSTGTLADRRIDALADRSTDALADRSIDLPAVGPFNLEATVRLLQRRPTNRIDRWEGGAYQRAVPTPAGLRLLRVTNLGTVAQPTLRLDVLGGGVSDGAAAGLVATIRWMLGLDAPPAPTAWLEEIEPRLAPVTHALQGFRTPCFPTLFETCAAVIPFQQLSLDAGTAIVGRMIERFGQSLTVAGQRWFSFPTPESIASAPPDELHATGLSRAKTSSLQKLARLSADGGLDGESVQALPTSEALATLCALPGIGPWSAGLILLRGLRRLDVFPGGDVGAARNLTALIEPAVPFTPDSASAFAASFGDRRGYLYFLALGEQLRTHGLLEASTTPPTGTPTT
ncbi:MAG: DNA-3-methyladenine glycosylase 2 [Chloroflexi bacterium]|nr:DNA-3-methyladenine glycosylase 2 [Chloroflexota bacterium]